MTGRCRVDTVAQPVGRVTRLTRRVELLLQRQIKPADFLRNALDRRTAQRSFLAEVVPVFGDNARIQRKRLHKDHADVRKPRNRVVGKHLQHRVETVRFHTVSAAQLVPDVVDADQDAEYIWIVVPAVLFDARINVNNAISADAEVQKFVLAGCVQSQSCADEQRISLSEPGSSAAVGDRVALE